MQRKFKAKVRATVFTREKGTGRELARVSVTTVDPTALALLRKSLIGMTLIACRRDNLREFQIDTSQIKALVDGGHNKPAPRVGRRRATILDRLRAEPQPS